MFEVLHYSNNYCHGLISPSSDCRTTCLLTGIYSHPKIASQAETLEFLKSLRPWKVIPLVVFGNFNEILTPDEKLGDTDGLKCQMKDFREVLLVCRLCDLFSRKTFYLV